MRCADFLAAALLSCGMAAAACAQTDSSAAQPQSPAAAPAALSAPSVIKTETVQVEDRSSLEWKFFQAQNENPDQQLAGVLLSEAESWLAANPAAPHADEMLFFKAEQQIKLKNYDAAVTTLLRHVFEYPDSSLDFKAKNTLSSLLDKHVERKLRQPLLDMIRGVDSSEAKQARMADFLTKTSAIAGEQFYGPLMEEYADFFLRYPNYEKNDALLLSKAAMNTAKGNYLGAILEYERILAVYPLSDLRPLAKRMTGDVYSNNIGDNNKAIESYQYVVDHFADSSEAGTAYVQMAHLAEVEKQYDLAVDVYEKIAKLYDGKQAAYDALTSEARILHEKLQRNQDAINVLMRVADKFKDDTTVTDPARKDDKAVTALKQAAQIARKELRDFAQEIKIYGRIVAEHPDSVDAPAMLLESGKVYEKDLLDVDNAMKVYQQVIDRYPGNSASSTAASRLKSLKKQQS
jgi:TolA-binding protein